MKSLVGAAVEQFRSCQQAQLLLERREAALQRLILRLATDGSPEDEAEYFRLTEKISKQYEEKRQKYGL